MTLLRPLRQLSGPHLLALRDVATFRCPSHRLERLGREDALVDQDEPIRPLGGGQVLVHEPQQVPVPGDERHLVRPSAGAVDSDHLVLDAKALVGQPQVVLGPWWCTGASVVHQADSVWQPELCMCVEELLLEFRHGTQHLFAQVWLAFALHQRLAGAGPDQDVHGHSSSSGEILVGQLVAPVVAERPQQGLHHGADGLVPVLARHVAVVRPCLWVPHWLAGELVLHVAPDAMVVVAEEHPVVDSGGVVGEAFAHRSA